MTATSCSRFVSPLGLVSLLACFLLGVFAPATAAADLTPEEMQRLEEHISTAAQATDAGNYQRAVEEWGAAAEMVEHPRIHLRLADAHVHLDQCSAAQEIHERVGRMNDLSDEVRQELRELGSRLEECSEFGEIYFQCTPSELTLEVDGQPWSCSQWEELEPGTYRARASHRGYETMTLEIRVDGGERQEREVELNEDPTFDDGSGGTLLYAGIGTSALGGMLLGVGAFRDSRTSARADEMLAARDAGDTARMNELRDEANSAQRTTLLTYGVGALALGAGAGMLIYTLLLSDDDEDPRLGLGVTGSGVEFQVRF